MDGLTRAVLGLAAVFGLACALLVPPTQGIDEPAHVFRAYTLLDGELLAETRGVGVGEEVGGCMVPWLTSAAQRAGQPGPMDSGRFGELPPGCDEERREFIVFNNAAVYSPVGYAGALAGVGAARVLGVERLWLLRLGRIGSLAAYLLLVGAALRLAPTGRIAIAVIALLPISVMQASTINIDGMAFGLVLLAAALTLRLRERERPDRRALAALAAVLAALALTKLPHLVFLVFLLLVPARHFVPAGRSAWVGRGAVALVAVVLAAAWNAQIADQPSRGGPPAGIDQQRQLEGVLGDPVGFAGVLRRSVLADQQTRDVWVAIPATFTFARATPVPGALPEWAVLLAFVLLAFALRAGRVGALVRDRRARLEGLALLGAGLAGAVLIYLALYLSWTVVGAPRVDGIEGRYFVPFLGLIVVAAAVLLPAREGRVEWQPYVATSVVLLLAVTYQAQLAFF